MLLITGAFPETIPILPSVGTCEKHIGGFTEVRYSVKYAKRGINGKPKRGSKEGKEE